jgi:hypothetical protein
VRTSNPTYRIVLRHGCLLKVRRVLNDISDRLHLESPSEIVCAFHPFGVAQWLWNMAQKPLNLRHYLVLTGTFRVKPLSHFCNGITALWLVHWTWKISLQTMFINSESNTEISNYFTVHFTKHLTAFGGFLYMALGSRICNKRFRSSSIFVVINTNK